MASHAPALALGLEGQVGRLRMGARADFVQLDGDSNLVRVWQGGVQL
jgi:N-acetylglucosamine-6-phosphate deacetylase